MKTKYLFILVLIGLMTTSAWAQQAGEMNFFESAGSKQTAKDFKPAPDEITTNFGTQEFGVDIIFETGVALIGAAVTAYILGILLDRQQENAAKWRAEIRRRLEESV